MKKITGSILWGAFFLCVLLVSTVFSQPEVDYDTTGRAYVQGEIIVRLRDSNIQALEAMGMKLNRTLWEDIVLMKLPETLSVEKALELLNTSPAVEYAEPNYIIKAHFTPDDPMFSEQWALPYISAPEAWDITTCTEDVVVAILDTGIQFDHPDLSQNIWTNPDEVVDGKDNDGNGYVDDIRGWNFVYLNNEPYDDHGHGSHVAGIIGAVGNNQTGIAGVCWRVRLMSLKIIDAIGFGTVADEIAAIAYAVKKGADIINASFGGEFFLKAEYDAVKMAEASGILLVASAGNGGADEIGDNIDIRPVYPASHGLSNIIPVTAIDFYGRLPEFANYGVNTVLLAAPGVSILSTKVYNSYVSYSGTSMSTAVVSGVSAMVRGYYRELTVEQVKNLLVKTVKPESALQGYIYSGGVVNAYNAISAMLPPTEVSAGFVKTDSAGIQWNERATAEDGYIIERDDGNGFVELATLPPDTTAYIDEGLVDGTAYRYRLRAYISDIGNGPYSETLEVVTRLAPPTELEVVENTAEYVSLRWKDNSAAEQMYVLQRATETEDFITLASLPADTVSYTDTEVKQGVVYRYRVMAYNEKAGYSEAAETEVKTPVISGSSGGGGGCSISAGSTPVSTAVSEVLLMFVLPFVVFWYLKIRH